MTTLQVRLWLPLARIVAGILFLILGPLRVKGKYRVPSQGGLLILSNHLADLDPIVIQLVCPRPIHFMGKSELFEMPVLGNLLRSFGSFPVRRGEPDRAPLRLAAQLLKQNEVVAIFPEGELSESGELLELKAGLSLIVRLASDTPVICCGIRNTNRALPYGKLIPRPAFCAITATWGEPHLFGKDSSSEEILQWATSQLNELSQPS